MKPGRQTQNNDGARRQGGDEVVTGAPEGTNTYTGQQHKGPITRVNPVTEEKTWSQCNYSDKRAPKKAVRILENR